MTTSDERQRVQALADEITQRIGSDPGFRAEIERDPVATLTAAGIPADRIGLAPDRAGDVAGYAMSDETPMRCLLGGMEDSWIWIKG